MRRVDRDRFLVCNRCGVRFLQREPARPPGGEPEPARCPGCRALDRLTARHRGVVRWYDPRKGYGFVRAEEGEDVFLHRSALEGVRRPRAGARVEFSIQPSDRGPVARRVCLLPR